ncbi:MAG: protein-disulfide isomerase, partial [Pseudohongiellaceae bacterium]
MRKPALNQPEPQSAQQKISSARFAAGLLGLAISLCASAALVAKHLHLFQAPGCGAGSACDQAADSIFGSVPLVGWPLSHFGLAWFTVLLVTWVACFRGATVSSLFRTVVRIGAAGSLVYIGAMLVGGYLCPYCLAVHVGMFAFLFAEAGVPRTSGPTLAFAARGALAFALVTGALMGAEAWQASSAEQERQQSTQSIIAATEASTPAAEGAPFVGRYPRGPERAPIRIVSFVDYACGSCRKVEEQAERILATRDDVMLSIKHFPLCSDCNEFASSTMHPDACRAAIAAETAGLLGGSDAVWELTRWLFDRKGSFSEPQLRAYVEQAGWDVEAFFTTLESEEPRLLVQADTVEADQLGVFGTPVVYINGVELKGFHGEDGLVHAVEDLAAAGLPA